jgi:uncharacterized protein
MRIAAKYAQKGKQIQWTIQTNGTLLNDQWCEFFRKNNYLVGISVDGPQSIHNQYRINSKGKGTFDEVMSALCLLKKYWVDYNILCCVHSGSSNRGREIYRFLRDTAGARYIQFIPVVERLPVNEKIDRNGTNLALTPETIGSREWGQFLIDVFEEWVHNDVGQVFVPLYDWTLASWMGLENPACILQPECGKALIIEHNGDLYSCDHFVDRDHFLGNILEEPLRKMLSSDKQQTFGAQKALLPKYCLKCEANFVCNGECPKNRFIMTPDSEQGLNYLCTGYKNFFNHVRKPMQMMADLLLSGHSAELIMLQYQRELTK